MAKYSVVIKRSAQKEIRDDVQGKTTRKRVVDRIAALANQPRPHGCEKLEGSQEKYRIRQGDYRILYEIDEETKTVRIIRVAQRGSVYRNR